MLACLILALATTGSSAASSWDGRIGGAWVWQGASGNEDSFLTQYNLRSGFNLEDLELNHTGTKGLEAFELEAHGFGEAFPTETARVGFRFDKDLALTLDYDRRESFFRLFETGLGQRSDDWDITRWKGELVVDTWEPVKFSFILRSREVDGTVRRPLYGLNELYPVGINLDDEMTEGTFRLETRTLPVGIDFEYSLAKYARKNRRFADGQQALDGTDPDLLLDSVTDFDDEQTVPTTRLTVSYGSRRFQGLATVLYSDADLETAGTGGNSFALDGGSIGTISFLNDQVGSAQAENLFGAIKLGFGLGAGWTLHLSGEIRDATTNSVLLGQRLVRTTSPISPPSVLVGPVNENGVYDFEDSVGRIRLEYRRTTWSVWAGGFTGKRSVCWRQTIDDQTFDVERPGDGYLVGGSWTPGKWFDLTVEYQQGDFTRFVFRTDPQTVDRAVLKLRSRLGGGWQIAAHGRYEQSANPTDVSGLDTKASPYGITANWASAEGASTAGIDVERMLIDTETGLVLPNGEPGVSRYDLDAISTTIHGATRAGIVRLHGSATYLTDDGATYPLETWNANARVTIRGPAGIEYGAFLEYWSYDEDLADRDDYDVTRGGVALSWSFR